MSQTVESGNASRSSAHPTTQFSREKGKKEKGRDRETDTDRQTATERGEKRERRMGDESTFRGHVSGGTAKETKSLAQKQTNKKSLA